MKKFDSDDEEFLFNDDYDGSSQKSVKSQMTSNDIINAMKKKISNLLGKRIGNEMIEFPEKFKNFRKN